MSLQVFEASKCRLTIYTTEAAHRVTYKPLPVSAMNAGIVPGWCPPHKTHCGGSVLQESSSRQILHLRSAKKLGNSWSSVLMSCSPSDYEEENIKRCNVFRFIILAKTPDGLSYSKSERTRT